MNSVMLSSRITSSSSLSYLLKSSLNYLQTYSGGDEIGDDIDYMMIALTLHTICISSLTKLETQTKTLKNYECSSFCYLHSQDIQTHMYMYDAC